eukprot:s1833_g14.t1
MVEGLRHDVEKAAELFYRGRLKGCSSEIVTMSQTKFVGVLSGANKFGRWIPEPEIRARAVAGAANLDFSQALFIHPEITIHATAFWGGVHLIVPPNVVVEQKLGSLGRQKLGHFVHKLCGCLLAVHVGLRNGRAIMGGFGNSGGLYHSSSGAMPETMGNTQITIKVRGTAVMGSVSAMVNRRATPARLMTLEEAQLEMQQPAVPSTTQEDMRQQILGEVFAAAPILQHLNLPGATNQATPSAPPQQAQQVVQGIPVPEK